MIFIRFFIMLVFLDIITCYENKLFKDVRKETVPLSSICVNKIVHKAFPCGTLISVAHTNEDLDSVLCELSKDACYSYIIRVYKNHNWLIPTKVYILTTTNSDRFTTDMAILTSDIFWDPKAHTIVVLEQQKEGDIEKVFDVLLRYNVFKTLVIQKIGEDDVAVFTYYPFKGTNCGLRYDYANIGNCSNHNNMKYIDNDPISLRNCNITVVASQDVVAMLSDGEDISEEENKTPGLEQYMLEVIAKKEGAELYYKLVPKDMTLGVVLPNNTATGLLNYLQRDEVDIALGGIILIKNRMDMFECIWGYIYASFNLYTPAKGEEIWKDVYKEFSLQTWLLIALAYCVITVVWIAVKHCKSRYRHFHDHGYISLELWGYLYVNTSKNLPKEVTMRRFMFFWIWFTFFISNFYNTALYSLLTSRDQVRRHINVDNLHDIPYEPCISESTQTYFQFSMNKTMPRSLDIPECMYADTALDYVASGSNAYAIELEYIYKLRENRYLDEDGHSKIDSWPFSTNNILAMYLTRGFPRTQEFQDQTWRMFETGLVEEHLNKKYHTSTKKVSPHEKHFKKIVLGDLRIHFLILATGSVVSMLCFVLELIWFSRKSKISTKTNIPFLH